MTQSGPSIDREHPSDNDLSAFASGRLPWLQIALLEQHLLTCDRCAEVVANCSHDEFIHVLRAAEQYCKAGATPEASPRQDSIESEPISADARVQTAPDALRRHTRYRITRWLAEGGMGAIYLAEHRVLRTPVAIKTIKSDRKRSRRVVDRFLQEAKTAARLDHANIARVWDVEQHDELMLLIMEYVPGKTLAQIVAKKGPLSVVDAGSFVSQVAAGLDHAAKRGVIHRDVKPHNVMVMTPDGIVKILDFGLGRITDDQRSHSRLTTDGEILGTPHFIAPEQILDSKAADIRSDIYSLGCTFYYLLAGEPPFRAKNPVELFDKHIGEQPLSIRSLRHDVPVGIADLLDRMVAKDPRARPQSPSDIVHELAKALHSNAHKIASPLILPANTPETARSCGVLLRNGIRSPAVFLPVITTLITIAIMLMR